MAIGRTKLTRRGLLALPAVAHLAFAASDFWNKKPDTDWTPEEIQTLRSKSPWSKRVSGEMTGGGSRRGFGSDAGGGAESGGGGGRRGGGGGGGGRGGLSGDSEAGGARGGGSGPQAPQVIIRWDSAKPLLEKSPLPEPLKEHYAVSITGLPPAMLMSVGRGQQLSEDPAERQKSIIARLLKSATLSVKGREPEVAQLLFQTADRQSLIFGFPKQSLPLSVVDKSVEFILKLPVATFKAKFELNEMMYNGQLAV